MRKVVNIMKFVSRNIIIYVSDNILKHTLRPTEASFVIKNPELGHEYEITGHGSDGM